jgi:hypothetical protein
MMDRQDLRDFWDAVWPFVPPAIGAWFGLKWSVQQTRKERVTTWFCSAFLSLYLGAAIGEQWQLGTKATSGVTILVAMLLGEAMGVAVAAARQWARDPVGTFRRWRDAWLGRGDEPRGGGNA